MQFISHNVILSRLTCNLLNQAFITIFISYPLTLALIFSTFYIYDLLNKENFIDFVISIWLIMTFFSLKASCSVMLYFLAVCCLAFQCSANANQTSTLVVDASIGSARRIPDTFFGVFFEEINHAGAGGLWAELVSNRGFEAGGTTSNIYPWSIIGDESFISVSTDLTSCFERNNVALRLELLCGGPNPCPSSGVGISNPGYWGMNIEEGKKYKVVYYVKSIGMIDLQISFTGIDGVKLASSDVRDVRNITNWRRMETILVANATDHNSSLQITTTTKGIYWLDQVSAMPLDTYKGHGFRNDLFQMVADLKPKFLRFPGGCYVEGNYLRNGFRWKDTVGSWEERPGHLNDIWNYSTDDGFGYFEFLQLAEDLGALPIWVFNAGISHHDEVNTSDLSPYVQDALDGIEFARGSPTSKWGSVRAAMGHPEPFELRYVAIGNEDCEKLNYQGNYLKIHDAIRFAYPNIQIISNCDGSDKPLNHPADLFDFHFYTSSSDMFSMSTKFDNTARSGPKAFVSEYAVWKDDAADGSLLSAVAEAAFLIGLEKNSDIVQMVCYAPLFLNINDRKWIPDAIVFNSYQLYGTPSYWAQKFFIESSGAIFLRTRITINSSNPLIASAINWQRSTDKQSYLRIKVVNFGTTAENLNIFIIGLNSNVQQLGSTKTVLRSANVMDENSFSQPMKVVPQQSPLDNAGKDMNVILPPHSVTSFDLLI